MIGNGILTGPIMADFLVGTKKPPIAGFSANPFQFDLMSPGEFRITPLSVLPILDCVEEIPTRADARRAEVELDRARVGYGAAWGKLVVLVGPQNIREVLGALRERKRGFRREEFVRI